MGDGGKSEDGSASGPVPDERDTNSVYDDFLQKVAHSPNVEPELLKEMAQRIERSLVGQRLAHFRVLDRLGLGGMGVVYRAEDEKLRRTVALKVVLSARLRDERRNQLLLAEARSAAAVGHPNIAAIYEVGEAEGWTFIAMEYVEGKSLRELVGEHGLLVGQALPLAVQIARGMARAHQGGIVHRDLKPDNVMVGPDGLVKLLDFGLALPLSALEQEGGRDGLPRAGRAVGTAAYMSPEQARGAAVDARSDVYSFGVVLFEMLVGRRPTSRAAHEEALVLVPVGAPAAQVEALRRVLGRCLEPRAEDRYPDGAALVEALQEVSDAGPAASSTPGGLPRPGGRPSGRPGRSWLLLVLGALALAVAASLIARLARRPREVLEHRLTANTPENLVVDAALSPDGRVLAYVDQRGLSLRSLLPERTEILRLPAPHKPQAVAWFPGGDELLVASAAPNTDEGRLWRIRRATGEVHPLGKGRYSSLRVASDGVTFAAVDGNGIRVGPVDLSNPRFIRPGQGERLKNPCWSPDGRRLGYVRVSQITASVETLSLDTGERQVLLETPRLLNDLAESALDWTANGEIVFALSDPPPKEVGFSLWGLAVDPGSGKAKGDPRLLRSWSGFYLDLLSVSASGSLAFARFDAQADVYVGDLTDGGRRMTEPRRVTPSQRNEYPTGWSPDGQTLLFTSDRDGTTDMFMQKLAGGSPVKLEAGHELKTWATFTPSGDGILFWRYPWPPDMRPQSAELRLLPLPPGPIVPVLTSRSAFGWTWKQSAPLNAHVRCAPAAGSCVLGEIEGGELVFSVLDPRLGRGRELRRIPALSVDGHVWDLSPDGGRIALPGRSGEVQELELSTGKRSTRVVAPGCAFNNVAWSADGAGLFATGRCSDLQLSSKIFRVGREGAAEVLWTQPSAWLSRPIASPDGRHLAFAAVPLDDDVWLVTGL